ncbi:MAG: glycine cleavage system aminomethyltransferase GcvT [Rikenellaceae bacterium]|nr:glycine cleavage system aminomethyltransferase GcvT [Rikenellaceae bacterium]
MKETPFTKYHAELGAKLVEFAGFRMPIEYTGINREHLAVRSNAGLFDVSHMGEIVVKGSNAVRFLQYVTANDITSLTDGKIQYSYFPNENGGIVDDLLVYRMNEEEYLLVVNASNIDKDWDFLLSHAGEFGVVAGRDLLNVSDCTAQLAIQGPKAEEIVGSMLGRDISDLQYYTFLVTDIGEIKEAVISATGYTGAGGYEIYVDSKYADTLWEYVWKHGEPLGLAPIGLGARDTLRLEMGFRLYGNDIDDSTSPIEAGLGWITKFTDDKDFIGRDIFEAQKKNGVAKKLRGFLLVERGVPRHGYKIADKEGRIIGEVASGTMSPCLKKGIGMGYIDTDHYDKDIYIIIRDKPVKTAIVNMPFIEK